MDDILKKLISSELLSEETKNEITEGFTSAVEEMRVSLREEIETEVKTQLVQEWTTQRNALVESIDEMVTAALQEEIEELKEDISSFRDLEVEYAERLTEEKKSMAETLSEEIDTLVDKLDQFLEIRIEEEFKELKEDISEARQNIFARKIFEAYAREYTQNFVDEDSLQAQVNVLEDKLSDAQKKLSSESKSIKDKLAESASAIEKLTREKTILETLAPLSGAKREQMAILLSNVETEKLSEAYAMYIGRILKEDKKAVEVAPIIESVHIDEKKTKIKTGDKLVEQVEQPIVEKTEVDSRLLMFAGLKKA